MGTGRKLLWVALAAVLLAGSAYGQFSGGGNTTNNGALPNANGQLPSMVGGVATSTIWVPTAAQTITTTTETSCFSSTGAGPGQTIPANGPYIGNRYRLRCNGIYTTGLANVATIAVKMKWGSTVITTGTTAALNSSLTNMPFYIDETCTLRTVGASGTVVCTGDIKIATAVLNIGLLSTAIYTTGTATIDTTQSSKVDITLTVSSLVGSPSISTIDGAVEILY